MASSSSSSVSTEETWEPLMGPKLTRGERRRLTQFLRAYMSCFAFSVATLLLEDCEDDTRTPEMGTWESIGTPKTLEFNCRGQNTLH
jgi:hypothetical protein